MIVWMMMVHVLGMALWVGGLLCAAFVLSQSAQQSDASLRGELAQLARRILRRMGDPGAALTILAGIGLFSTNSQYFSHATWIYVKLVNVAILIGLHGLIGIRIKRQATGSVSVERREAMLLWFAVLIAVALILAATFPLRSLAP